MNCGASSGMPVHLWIFVNKNPKVWPPLWRSFRCFQQSELYSLEFLTQWPQAVAGVAAHQERINWAHFKLISRFTASQSLTMQLQREPRLETLPKSTWCLSMFVRYPGTSGPAPNECQNAAQTCIIYLHGQLVSLWNIEHEALLNHAAAKGPFFLSETIDLNRSTPKL